MGGRWRAGALCSALFASVPHTSRGLWGVGGSWAAVRLWASRRGSVVAVACSGVAPGAVAWAVLSVFAVFAVFFLPCVCDLAYTFFCLFWRVFSLFVLFFFGGYYLVGFAGVAVVPRGTLSCFLGAFVVYFGCYSRACWLGAVVASGCAFGGCWEFLPWLLLLLFVRVRAAWCVWVVRVRRAVGPLVRFCRGLLSLLCFRVRWCRAGCRCRGSLLRGCLRVPVCALLRFLVGTSVTRMLGRWRAALLFLSLVRRFLCWCLWPCFLLVRWFCWLLRVLFGRGGRRDSLRCSFCGALWWGPWALWFPGWAFGRVLLPPCFGYTSFGVGWGVAAGGVRGGLHFFARARRPRGGSGGAE